MTALRRPPLPEAPAPVRHPVPDFVRRWEPTEMGTLVRRPVFALPAENRRAREQGPDRDEDPELVRRVSCSHRGGQCPFYGRCGAPIIVLPERELGQASANVLRMRGEVWEP